MLLAGIIAKVLALTEGFLDFFVTVTATNGVLATGGGQCYNVPQYTTQLTACGSEFVGTLAGLTDAVLQIFQGILPGLMAK